MYTDLSSTVV